MTLSNKIGLTQVPAQTGSKPAADPVLSVLGSYLQVVLEHTLGDAWREVAPSEPLVRRVYFRAPEATMLKEQALPAIFLFRERALPPEQMGSGYRIYTTRLRLFLFAPPCSAEKRAKRETVLFQAGTFIDDAIESYRHPAWIVAGDPDPCAAELGSLLLRYTNAWSIEVQDWLTTDVLLRRHDGSGPGRTYRALNVQLLLKEHRELDTSFGTYPTKITVEVKKDDLQLGSFKKD